MCEKLFLALRTELLRSAAFKTAFAGILTTVLVFSHFEAAGQSVFKKNSSLPQRPETAVSASTANEKLVFDSVNPIGQGINTYYWLNSPGFTTTGGFQFTGNPGFPVANL